MSWEELSSVEGDLINLIRQASSGDPTKIDNGKFSDEIRKSGPKYEVKLYGEGGGYFASYRWGAKRIQKHIARHQTGSLTFLR